MVEHNKRKHSRLRQETENSEFFAVTSLTQKKYNNDNCIVLVINFIDLFWGYAQISLHKKQHRLVRKEVGTLV